MLYKNLTVKELYASISDEEFIYSMFIRGLQLDNDRLAVSAMEELIVRGFTDKVFHGLRTAFMHGNIKAKTTITNMIARSLNESCRGVDTFLHKFGKFLLKAEGPDPFRQFIEGEGGKIISEACNESLSTFCGFDDSDVLWCRLSKYLNTEDSRRKLRDLLKMKKEKARFEELLGDEESLKKYLYQRIGDYRL